MPNSSRRQFLSAGLMLPMAGAATGLDLLSSREAGAEPFWMALNVIDELLRVRPPPPPVAPGHNPPARPRPPADPQPAEPAR